MGFLDYFKPSSEWSADGVRNFLRDKSPDAFNLVDVRQPKEYEKEHLPGAKLIPVGELEERRNELDPEKPTVAY